MKNYITATCWAICLLCTCRTAIAESPVVSVYAKHYASAVQYCYRVVNNGMFGISGIWIGYDRSNPLFELKTHPSGMVIFDIPAASRTSPLGWEVFYIGQEETLAHSIRWHVVDSNASPLSVGGVLSGMCITLDKIDNTYVSSHATIHFSNRPASEDISVPLQRFDMTPPTLRLSLSQNSLQPNEKLVPITANISVKDDYDPAPEIKLESITSNELLEAEDIRDARLGTDDRQFMLKAKSEEMARVYTVVYSATDASGNRAVASATVTVPHDNEARWKKARD